MSTQSLPAHDHRPGAGAPQNTGGGMSKDRCQLMTTDRVRVPRKTQEVA